MQHHNYSLQELENMIPWEREVYVGLLIQYLKEKEEREKIMAQNQKNYNG
tara:strand:+ start:882 stop:1031 length:150 start_codon:yes stop_codon:yes gene_type:complete